MLVDEMAFPARPPIDGYGPDFFRIGGTVFRGPTLILPDRVGAWTGPGDASAILESADSLDLLLLGTGAEISPVSAAFERELRAAGVAVEAMATPAACRTYNVLLAEGRRLSAALLPLAPVAKS